MAGTREDAPSRKRQEVAPPETIRMSASSVATNPSLPKEGREDTCTLRLRLERSKAERSMSDLIRRLLLEKLDEHLAGMLRCAQCGATVGYREHEQAVRELIAEALKR